MELEQIRSGDSEPLGLLLEDIQHLQDRWGVMAAGRWYSESTLQQMVGGGSG